MPTGRSSTSPPTAGCRCGTTTKQLSLTDFDPAQTAITLDNLSQLNQLVGMCTVFVGLVENSGSPPPLIFGGTISPAAQHAGRPRFADPGEPREGRPGRRVGRHCGREDQRARRATPRTASTRSRTAGPKRSTRRTATVCGTSSPAHVRRTSTSRRQLRRTSTAATRANGRSRSPTTTEQRRHSRSVSITVPAGRAGAGLSAVHARPAFFAGVGRDHRRRRDGQLPRHATRTCSPAAASGSYTLVDPTGRSCGDATGPPSPSDGTAAQITLPAARRAVRGVDGEDRRTRTPRAIRSSGHRSVDGTPPES